MLGQRRRRRANINPALGQCIVFAGSDTVYRQSVINMIKAQNTAFPTEKDQRFGMALHTQRWDHIVISL